MRQKLLIVAAMLVGGTVGMLPALRAQVSSSPQMGGGGCDTTGIADNTLLASNGIGGCEAGVGGSGTLTGTLTATRVPFASGATTLVDDADLTFATDTLTGTIINGSTRIGFGLLDAAGAITIGSGGIISEGATANTEELAFAFGDHTADNTLTWLSDSTGVSISSGASVSNQIGILSGLASGVANLYVASDQGLNSFGSLIQYGSTAAGTLYGQAVANKTSLSNNGSTNTGLLIGSPASDTIVFGTNNAIRAEVAAASNLWTFGGVAGAASSIAISNDAITSEGSSADANELVLAFGNHTADITTTLTATAATLTFTSPLSQTYAFTTTDAGTSAIVEAQSTSNTGLGALRAKNDQGTNANALFAVTGSAHGSTFAGVSSNNLAVLQAAGSSLSGLLLNVSTADPLILGANNSTRYYIAPSAKSLTDNTLTGIFTITLGDDTDGGGTVSFCATSGDLTTTRQKTCGEINFAGVDVTAGAGGEVCTAAVTGTNSSASSSGTLTVTATAATGTDLCTIQVTADSSLDVASTIMYSVTLAPSASTVVVNPL